MASPSAPAPTNPGTHGEAGILARLKTHTLDPALHPAGAAIAGQVPTWNGSAWVPATPPGSAGGAPLGTATPLADAGTGTVGASTGSAPVDHQHPLITAAAADRGFKAMPYGIPISSFTATAAFTSGTLYLVRARMETTGTLSAVRVRFTTGGASLTNCYVGVYSMAGTLLASSTDQSASWASAGGKSPALAGPTVPIPAGTDVWLALLYNGTSLAGQVTASLPLINDNLVCQGTAGTGLTTLPANLGTISSVTACNYLAGI